MFGQRLFMVIWIILRRSRLTLESPEFIRGEYVNFDNFNIYAITKNDNIYVSIILGKYFSKEDYQKFNFAIYEVIRHELEHMDELPKH